MINGKKRLLSGSAACQGSHWDKVQVSAGPPFFLEAPGGVCFLGVSSIQTRPQFPLACPQPTGNASNTTLSPSRAASSVALLTSSSLWPHDCGARRGFAGRSLL